MPLMAARSSSARDTGSAASADSRSAASSSTVREDGDCRARSACCAARLPGAAPVATPTPYAQITAVMNAKARSTRPVRRRFMLEVYEDGIDGRAGKRPPSNSQVTPQRQEGRHRAQQHTHADREDDDADHRSPAQLAGELQRALEPVDEERLGPHQENGREQAADQA